MKTKFKSFSALVVLLVITAVTGCAGTNSPATQQTDFQLVGGAVATAIGIAEAVPQVAPFDAEINIGIGMVCAIDPSDPTAAMTLLKQDIGSIWTNLNVNTPLAVAAMNTINLAWTTIQGNVNTDSSSQAIADIQAFQTGLCSVAKQNGTCKVMMKVTAKPSFAGSYKWNTSAAWTNFKTLIGFKR